MILLSNSNEKARSLKDIYKSGKIEFVRELRITRDSFPGNVSTNLMVGYCKGKEYIYIADALGCDIKMINFMGNFIRVFGQKGKGPGDMYLPYYMTFSQDKLLVWESGNRRFSIFGANGNFLRHVNPEYKGRVVDIKTLYDGRIIVEREAVGWVNGNLEQYFGLELFSKDFNFLKDLYKKQISRYIPLETKRQLIRPFPRDVSWAILKGNKVLLGCSDKYQIDILDPTSGNLNRYFSHLYTPIKVTEPDKAIFFNNIVSVNSSGSRKFGADEFTKKYTKFPDYKPAFKKIITDYEDNILVFTYKKSEAGDSKHIGKCFDAFDPEGCFINHVDILTEGGVYLYNISSVQDNIFWSIAVDDEYDTAIVKYRVK